MTRPDTDKIREQFARVLRQKRHKLNLSQEELAHRAGLAMRYISLLECNKRQPTISTLFQLSKALEIPLSEIFFQIENEMNGKGAY